jgi:hypothetical protein
MILCRLVDNSPRNIYSVVFFTADEEKIRLINKFNNTANYKTD